MRSNRQYIRKSRIVRGVSYEGNNTDIGSGVFISSCNKKPIEQENREIYCEMIEAYKKTGGDYGWPPFDGECE